MSRIVRINDLILQDQIFDTGRTKGSSPKNLTISFNKVVWCYKGMVLWLQKNKVRWTWEYEKQIRTNLILNVGEKQISSDLIDWNSELSISQKLAISASDEDPLIREYFLHFAYENYTEIYLPLHLHRLWSSLCDQNSDIKIAILGKKCLWHQMLPPKHSNYSTEKKFILRWVPLIFMMENPVSYITIYNTDY